MKLDASKGIKTASVKNVKSCDGRDGIAWSGTLYLNGKRAALVRDSGDGGEINFDWHPSGHGFHGGELAKAFDIYAAAQPPIEADPEYDIPECPCEAGILVSRLCDEYEEAKQIKRLCRTNIVCRTSDGQLVAYKAKATTLNRAMLAKRHPGYTILNP